MKELQKGIANSTSRKGASPVIMHVTWWDRPRKDLLIQQSSPSTVAGLPHGKSPNQEHHAMQILEQSMKILQFPTKSGHANPSMKILQISKQLPVRLGIANRNRPFPGTGADKVQRYFPIRAHKSLVSHRKIVGDHTTSWKSPLHIGILKPRVLHNNVLTELRHIMGHRY